VPGSNVEGRSAFEYRRRQSVARNAFNTAAAVRAAVLEVDGVLDVYVIDNKEPTSVEKGSTNYTLLASSIYIGVYGGQWLTLQRPSIKNSPGHRYER
jgi:hypothetical protein